MKTHQKRVIDSSVDFLYKKMTSYSLKERKVILKFYKKWRIASSGEKKIVIINNRVSEQILDYSKIYDNYNKTNRKKINDFIDRRYIPDRKVWDYSKQEYIYKRIQVESISYNSEKNRFILLHTNSDFDTIKLTVNQFLKLNLQSKLPLWLLQEKK